MKREAALKSAFFTELTRQLPSFIVQLMASAGSPDRSISGNGQTTHWEFKHGTPSINAKGDQTLMCMRLAIAAHCRYVVWWESWTGLGKRTMIVHPCHVHDRTLLPEVSTSGFDHGWLVEQVKKAHGL